ncbi:MAG: DUF2155 domain-containing protein, partial [Nitrospinaceae bacterium]|nr:DUF2155 domain-containing protein [Nitrospinaceae bacterium]NIR56850.1 DUF2155 domain-containing protein [Nitrospinaceae bacterium]NIT84170.1 DUF2155 domain-containing protein [Nitrospinaceae bacterium]NIW07911.1 DUF2155 domain-containing protein [Nitrospinaceae bacterium]NIX36519.1 DUF2155 domain-containing protein [Nitrospinaceae bacterium]
NPAVQLVVEREGEIIYKGWAFEKFPDLYSFEHKDYQLQLVGYVKAETS